MSPTSYQAAPPRNIKWTRSLIKLNWNINTLNQFISGTTRGEIKTKNEQRGLSDLSTSVNIRACLLSGARKDIQSLQDMIDFRRGGRAADNFVWNKIDR